MNKIQDLTLCSMLGTRNRESAVAIQLKLSEEAKGQLEANLSALQNKQNELIVSHRNKDEQINTLIEQRENKAHWHQENKRRAESLQKELQAEKQEGQELRDKLTLASKYYFKLQQAHPEVLSDTPLMQSENEGGSWLVILSVLLSR